MFYNNHKTRLQSNTGITILPKINRGYFAERGTLKAEIAAANSGNLPEATELFAQVVKVDPTSEEGWLGLGFCVSAPDQRIYCFRHVLALNPNNHIAKEQLAQLSKPDLISPPVQTKQPAFAKTIGDPKLTRFYLTSTGTDYNSRRSPSAQAGISSQTVQTAPKAIRQNRIVKRKKKSNAALIIVFLTASILIICGLGIGYIFFSAGMPSVLGANQPPLPVQSSVQLNTQPAKTPISTSSPTSNPPTPIPSPVPTVAYTPTFENATCQFTTPTTDVNCGYLIVPEDRTGDPSHTIKLAVAIYHSRNQNPAEPVVFLQGGPGAEAVKLSADDYSVLVAPFLSKRDFITFDQRGTGLSEPALNCDDLTKLYSQDIHGLIPASTRDLVYSNAL